MSAISFKVTYKYFRKVVQCKEYANIYDDVALKFSNCPIFSRRIKLQYEWFHQPKKSNSAGLV